MKKEQKDDLKRKLGFIAFYGKQYLLAFVVVTIMAIVISLLETSLPYMFGRLVDLAAGKGGLWGLSFGEMVELTLIAAVVSALIRSIAAYLFNTRTFLIERDVVCDLQFHSLNLPIDVHETQKSSEIYAVIDRTKNAVHRINSIVIKSLLFHVLIMGFCFTAMFAVNIFLALLTIICAGGYFAISYLYRMPELLARQNEINNGFDKIYGQLGDSLCNVFSVKTSVTQVLENEKVELAFNETIVNQVKQMLDYLKNDLFSLTFSRISQVGIIALAAYMLSIGMISFGDVVQTVGYMAMVFRPIRMLADDVKSLRRSLVDLEKAIDLRDREKERDLLSGKPIELEGGLKFKDVSFNYPNRNELVLDDVSFSVGAGRTLAIVGMSGAGKTTLYRLILGLYEDYEGAVLLDGHDSHHVSLSSLRKQIAVVPQNPSLFNTTIKENISYGTKARMKDIVEAAKKAGIHKFVESLPDGYDTLVGERGIKLSGGQMQRIVIARAILADPKILILDEATSSLDPITKFEVIEAMQNLIKGRTTIIITHDFSVATKSADEIIVLDQGKVVQSGKHEELVNQPGLYQSFCQKLEAYLGCSN